MPQVQLYQTWIYAGKHYGPGVADLPDEVYAALEAKKAFEPPAPSDLPSREMLTVAPVLASDVSEKLAAGGYDTVEAIRAATDAELLAVKGIGPAAVAAIREAYGDASSE